MTALAGPDALERLLASGPYKGLAPFEDSDVDARLFFGRDVEREVVEANLFASRLTVLYGPSGVGKSSLLRAGVVHGLRRRARKNLEELGHPDFAVVPFDRWNDDPVEGIARVARAELTELFGDVVATSPDASASLTETLERWSRELDCDLLLVLDQAEEYFLYHAGEEGAGTFEAELPELVTHRLRVNVLLSLREDQLAKLDRFKGRIPNLFANYLRVDHLDPRAATAAIIEPLEEYNRLVPEAQQVDIEPALVEAVLEETLAGKVDISGAGSDPTSRRGPVRVEAPYLQLVLQRLWQQERATGSSSLRLETLAALGGAQEIARTHLERALAQLADHDQDVAASVFLHLVTPSGTKVAHAVGDLAEYTGTPAAELEPVLDVLARERILKPVQTPGLHTSSNGSYEIFHDVLGDAVLAWRARHAAQRALERERTRRRRAVAFASAALLALAAVAGIALFALYQRQEARDGERSADAGRLAATALSQLAVDPELGILLALEAARKEPSQQVEDILRRALLASHIRRTLPGSAAAIDQTDGNWLAVGGADGGLQVYELPSVRLVGKADFGSRIDNVRFTGTNAVLALGGGELHEWRPGNVRELDDVIDATDLTRPRDLSTPYELATIDKRGRLHLWTRWGDDNAPAATPRLPEAVRSLVRSPLPGTVAAIGDKHVYVVEAGSSMTVRRLDHGATLSSAAFDPSGRRLVTTGGHRYAIVWNVRAGRAGKRLVALAPLLDARFSPDGIRVATAGVDGVARIYDTRDGALVATLFGHENFVRGVAFSPEGRLLASLGDDGTARVWEAAAGRLLAALPGHGTTVRSADFTYTRFGAALVTTAPDGRVRFWDPVPEPDIPVGVRLPVVPETAEFANGGHSVRLGVGATTYVVRTSDGRVLRREQRPARPLVVRSIDGSIARIVGNVVRIKNGANSVILRGHSDVVTSVAFSRDGARVVTASVDRDARIWDPATGRTVRALRGHFGPLGDAAFSADGRWVVTAGPLAAGLWDATSGLLVFFLRGQPGPLRSVSFLGNGYRIQTVAADRVLRVYNCEVCGRLPALRTLAEARLARTGRELSADERRRFVD